jgi:hypothetical protein
MQDLLAILIACLAAAFLAYRGWIVVMKRKSGCGACANCPSGSTATQPANLVQLSPMKSHAEAQR